MVSVYSVQVGGLLDAVDHVDHEDHVKASESPGIKKALGLGCEQRVNHIVLNTSGNRKAKTMKKQNTLHIQDLLEKIALDHLFIQTLETQMSDRLDFHEVSVWAVKSALQAAFEAGSMATTQSPTQTNRN